MYQMDLYPYLLVLRIFVLHRNGTICNRKWFNSQWYNWEFCGGLAIRTSSNSQSKWDIMLKPCLYNVCMEISIGNHISVQKLFKHFFNILLKPNPYECGAWFQHDCPFGLEIWTQNSKTCLYNFTIRLRTLVQHENTLAYFSTNPYWHPFVPPRTNCTRGIRRVRGSFLISVFTSYY